MLSLKKLFLSGFIFALFCVLSFLVILLFLLGDLPAISSLKDYRPALVTSVFARDGRLIGEFYKERRYVLPMEEIPSLVVDVFVSAEDDRFFDHTGVDFYGIFRAALANLKAGRVVQGGSTITQQVAKSLLLSSERSFRRKLKEAILANQIERSLSKKEILFLYLNQIYLGSGAYGIEAAAQTYFNKRAKELTLAEAALLAGLAQAPSSYSPMKNFVQARRRQLYVLNRMLEVGHANQEEYQVARDEDIRLYLKREINQEVSSYYVEHVRQRILEQYGQEKLYTEGLKVYTAADYDLSLVATKSTVKNLRNLDKRQGYRGPLKKISLGDKEVLLAELKRMQFDIFKKKYPFLFLPKDRGTLFNREEWQLYTFNRAKELGLFENPRELLLLDQTYRAVVTRIEKDGKSATVMMGEIEANLSIDRMAWAKRIQEGKTTASGEKIRSIKETLRVGDVVEVRVVKVPLPPIPEAKGKKRKGTEKEKVEVALEQLPAAQSALVSMEVETGHVITMVGGFDFKNSEYNRVLQSRRQPGSAFKPFVYAAALDKGYNPASIIIDSPIIFESKDDEKNFKWIPENYSEHFYGDTTLRMALIKSRNVPTVKLLKEIQIPYLMNYVRGLGAGGSINPDLSLALGSNAISLMNLTRIYALFPRNGLQVEPVYILKILDRTGEVLFKYDAKEEEAKAAQKWLEAQKKVEGEKQEEVSEQPKEEGQVAKDSLEAPQFDNPMRVMNAKTAFIMGDLLRQVVTSGTGRGAKILKRRVGGKTGTTNDFIDAWFVGFSPEVVTGVWTGFDSPKTLGRGETGARAALPAWISYMRSSLEVYRRDVYDVPEGIVFVRINPKDGSLAETNDTSAVRVAFREGSEPSRVKKQRQAPDSSDFFSEDF